MGKYTAWCDSEFEVPEHWSHNGGFRVRVQFWTIQSRMQIRDQPAWDSASKDNGNRFHIEMITGLQGLLSIEQAKCQSLRRNLSDIVQLTDPLTMTIHEITRANQSEMN